MLYTKIDTSLPVSWCLELIDGTKFFDGPKVNGKSAWEHLIEYSIDNPLNIKNLHLFATKNAIDSQSFRGALCKEYSPSYFFSYKILANPLMGQINLYGIGDYNGIDAIIEIRWYTEDMSLLENTNRNWETAKWALLKNHHEISKQLQ